MADGDMIDPATGEVWNPNQPGDVDFRKDNSWRQQDYGPVGNYYRDRLNKAFANPTGEDASAYEDAFRRWLNADDETKAAYDQAYNEGLDNFRYQNAKNGGSGGFFDPASVLSPQNIESVKQRRQEEAWFNQKRELDKNAYEFGGYEGGAKDWSDAALANQGRAQEYQDQYAMEGAGLIGVAREGGTAKESDYYSGLEGEGRDWQQDALGLSAEAAYGNAPSVAQEQLGYGLSRTIAEGASAAASARGAGALAMAQQNAAANTANAMQNTNQQNAILRAQEMAQARQEYAQGSQALRAADQARLQQNSQMSQFNAEANQQLGQLGLGLSQLGAQYGNQGQGYFGQAADITGRQQASQAQYQVDQANITQQDKEFLLAKQAGDAAKAEAERQKRQAAVDEANRARREKNSSIGGSILGALGAVGGAIVGGPAGASAGYSGLSTLGKGLGNYATKSTKNPYDD